MFMFHKAVKFIYTSFKLFQEFNLYTLIAY